MTRVGDDPDASALASPDPDLDKELKKLKDRNDKLKTSAVLLTLVLILVIAALVALLLFALLYRKTSEPNEVVIKPYTICKRSECYELAKFLNDSMDISADPCNDFYQFACGGFVKKHGPDESQTLIETNVENIIRKGLTSEEISNSSAVQFVKRFYQRCVQDNVDEQEEINVLKSFLVEMGGMPLMDSKTYNSTIPWWKRQAILIREFSYMYRKGTQDFPLGILIHIELGDDKAILNQPGKDLFLVNWLSKENSTHEVSKNKTELLSNALCYIIGNACSTSKKSVSTPVEEALAFEKKLYSLKNKTLEGRSDKHITALETEVPSVPWKEFFKEVLKDSSVNMEVNPFKEAEVNYYILLARLVNETNPEVLANYLGLKVINMFMQYIFSNITYSKIIGQESSKTGLCYSMIKFHLFPEVASRMLVEEVLRAKGYLNEMSWYLRNAFLKLIDEKAWLDENTKKIVREKLMTVKINLGSPKWITNNEHLKNFYLIHTDVETKSFLHVLRSVYGHNVKEAFLQLQHPTYGELEWDIMPYDNNAVNVQDSNSVFIPAANFLPLSYWTNGVKSVNYGIVGYTIGHELGHSLDPSGVNYNKFGNAMSREKWFSNASYAVYHQQLNCLIKQYSGYDKESNVSYNGSHTLKEDFADNTGIRVAYNAYLLSGREDERLPGLEQFDDTKLFFIATANYFCTTFKKIDLSDVHSPDKFRTFKPASNFDEFAKTFECVQGSIMNREEKCVIF